MPKCSKSCPDSCCKVKTKTKRKATARRAPRPPVFRGVSANVLGGSEQMYVNNLNAYLQNLNRPQVAQNAGLAVPVRPVMISTGTDARPLMVSDGIQATIATRTGATQARAATAETGTGMDARATAEAGTVMDATTGRTYGTQTYGTQVMRRPRPATATTGTGTDALPSMATTGTQVTGANLAALVPLPPSPAPSVVEADTRGVGMQTEPQGTGARAVARLFGALQPQIFAQRAANLQEARDIGIAEGYRQGRGRGEQIGALQGAQEAIENLRFQQTTRTRGTETFTVPELQQRFAEGGIIRAAGGRARAVEAAAEEAAPK